MRRSIIDGVYGPGVQLRELELALAFGVSRNSLRAAFRELEHLGLVEHQPNRGVFVRRFAADEIRDYFCLRSAVESEAARRTVTNPAELVKVRDALKALEALPPDAPWHACIDADLALHRELVRAARSPRLSRLFDGLEAEFLLLLAHVHRQYPTPQPALVDQHTRLVKALHSGNPATAVHAIQGHLEQSLTECLAHCAPPTATPYSPTPAAQHDDNTPPGSA